MKIRKIFAGLTVAALSASMMSLAASAAETKPFIKAADEDVPSYANSQWNISSFADVLADEDNIIVLTYNNPEGKAYWGNISVGMSVDSTWKDWNFATGAEGDGLTYELKVSDIIASVQENVNDEKVTSPIKDVTSAGSGKFETYNGCVITDITVKSVDKIQTIDTVDLTVVAPQPGDEVKLVDKTSGEITYKEPDKTPEVTFASDANFAVADKFYITAYPGDDGDTTPFEGTFESGKDYYVELFLEAKEGYQFAAGKDIALKVNGKTDNFKIGQYYMDESSRGLLLYATVTSETVDVEYTAEKTDGYTYTLGSDEIPSIVINRSIGNDKTFGLFKSVTNGDKELVKDTDYTAESGSLKLALTKAYLNSLAAGDYTFKVAFEDGEAEFKLTVAEAPAQEPTTEEPKTEEPKTEEPKTEEPKTEEPKDETPKTGAAAGALAAIALVGGVAVVASRKRK